MSEFDTHSGLLVIHSVNIKILVVTTCPCNCWDGVI